MAHFTVVPCGLDAIVALRLPPEEKRVGGPSSQALQSLDQLLLRSVLPTRHRVRDVMVFCLDNAKHAAPLARRLACSLGEKGLSTNVAITRLFIINDVLLNANSC